MPDVVTCLLVNKGKLLILKRSEKVRTYKGLWGGVAGYVEPDEDPYETALKEIKEEVGLDPTDVHLIKKGKTELFTDSYEGETYEWVIHPFVFEIEQKDKLHIDWEHSEYAWIVPTEIKRYAMVPHLKTIIQKNLR